MTTPQFNSPDGELREEVAFNTTMGSRFFTGVLASSTIDVEVSIRGGAFTNDPDLILFDAGTFTVPNPASFPDGLDLLAGDNVIQVRARSLNSVSAPATATTTFVEEFSGIDADPPTGISVQRLKDSVVVQVTQLPPLTPNDEEEFNVRGLNFYASADEGGGETGYTKINANLVEDYEAVQVEFVQKNLESEYPLVGGSPRYVRMTYTQEDLAQNTTSVDVDERTEILDTNTVRIRTNIFALSTRRVYNFDHNRSASPSSIPPTISNGTFSALSEDEPLYYVVTAVYFDPVTNTEIESSYSAEVSAKPTEIRDRVGTFPVADRETILRDLSLTLFRSNPDIAIQPGSVVRDTVLDPFTSEAERIRFIIDFLYRASSFSTLLSMDDPNFTGTSLTVAESDYKKALGQALFLTNDTAVQNVVDRAFEKMASNFGVLRLAGTSSRGEATFFLRKRPTRTYQIPLGTQVPGPVTFRTLRAASIPFENSAAFYDPSTGRYLVRVPIQALETGTAGNLAVGQISGVINGLSVTNESKTFGGDERESNLSLATRAQNRLSSVDAGTERGYYRNAIEVPGVISANVIEAGDPLMQRDYDPEDKIHRGGKVDVWVQGTSVANVSDTFSFTFEIAREQQFVSIGDPAALEFRSLDSALSVTNPLVEMLDRADIGLGLRNASTGMDFDLTGVTITSFNTIQLDSSIPQPALTLTSVVLGDYRYRTGETFTMTRQPVGAITSVVGENSGTLSTEDFLLVRPEPLLNKGRSTKAGDYLLIREDVAGSANFDTPVVVTSEEHVLTADNPEFVDRLGANELTVKVFNADRTVEYRGPFDSSGVFDYTITAGEQTTALSVRRVDGGAISNGETVLIDYEHGENFTIRYTINLIVDTVQDEYAKMRHTTADVLAKEAVSVPVDIMGTIVLERGVTRNAVDQKIRQAIGNFFNRFRTDNPVRQSDIIAVIEEVKGVSHVIQPLTKMVKQENALVVRETLVTGQVGDTHLVSSWSTGTTGVWLVRDEFSSATTTGGGPEGEFRAVFQNDDQLVLQTVNPSSLGSAPNQSYIIGSEGLIIPGFSDTATLTLDGFNTNARRAAERINRTANRILVSLDFGSSPSSSEYSVTYVVTEDVSVQDLNVGAAEYFVTGTLQFTYDEAREDSIRRV